MHSEIPKITEKKDPRRIGFEIEFAGLELDKAADIIQRLYGGSVSKSHRYHYKITGTELGTFRIELDAQILRRMANDNNLKKWGIDFSNQDGSLAIEQIVDRVAKTVVPIEIVMPPVPIDKIDRLEPLRAELQKHKAEGTGVSLVHAFGTHINIECPDNKIDTILRYLRAFLLLYPWLLRELKIDVTRKISPFVDAFPERYVKQVIDPSYQPSYTALIDDYLLYNATRNRPLDLLPIFAMRQPKKIERALKDEKNKARPAFHYRMPNSRIDDAGWRLHHELEYWVQVEVLAAKTGMINKLSRLYLLRKNATLVSFKKEWAQTVSILLDLDV